MGCCDRSTSQNHSDRLARLSSCKVYNMCIVLMATFQAHLPEKKFNHTLIHLIFTRENNDCEVVASQLAPALNGWYQLWDRKTLLFQANASVFIRAPWRRLKTSTLMKTDRNIGKVFQSQSWYQRTLFSIYVYWLWLNSDWLLPYHKHWRL